MKISYKLKKEDIFLLAQTLGSYSQHGDELHFDKCPYCHGGEHNDKKTCSINIISGAFNCLRSSCGKHGHFVELARDFSFALEKESKQYRKLPQSINSHPTSFVFEYFKTRNISQEVIERFKVSQAKDNKYNLCFPFYDENHILQFVKIRNTKKNAKPKEWCVADCKPILFGMAQCMDFSTLIITEGQIDSLSLAECGYMNAVSVPLGATAFSWVQHCYDWLIKFERIIIFGDLENGKMSLLEKLRSSLPTKLYSVQHKYYLSEKDANDILTKYGKNAIIEAINNAKIEDIKHVKRLSEVESVDIYSMPKILTGVKTLDATIGGLYFGQVILLSGKRGEGKSTFLSQLVAESINQNYPTFIYSGELPNFHFKRWLDLQIAGADNIDTIIDELGVKYYTLSIKTIDIINRWYFDKAYIFDNSAINDDEYKGLLNIIIDSICRYNIKLVCIDNLMTAIDDDVQSDVYRQQSQFVKMLTRIAKQYDIAIILIAHPKKTVGEFDNDAVSGSADITNLVDTVINYQRIIDGDADSKLTVTKNRLTGKLLIKDTAINLMYSETSKRIAEASQFKPKQYNCFANKEDSQNSLDGLPV